MAATDLERALALLERQAARDTEETPLQRAMRLIEEQEERERLQAELDAEAERARTQGEQPGIMLGQGSGTITDRTSPEARPAPALPRRAPVTTEDKSSAAGDLQAGVDMLQAVPGGLRSAWYADQLTAPDRYARGQEEGTERRASQLEEEAAKWEEGIALAEAEGRSVPDRNREEAARLRAEAEALREGLSSPEAQAVRDQIDERARAAVEPFLNAVRDAAGHMQDSNANPMNPSAQAFAESEGWEAIGYLADDPLGVVRSMTLRSLGVSAPSALAAVIGQLAGPGGAAAGAFLVGGSVEMGVHVSAEITAALEEKGIDPTDEASVLKWAQSNPDDLLEIIGDSAKRAAAIATVEGATAGIGGLIARGVGGTGAGRRVAGGTVATTADIGGEGAGEAAALAATGEPITVGAVGSEMIGAGGMAAAQQAGQQAAEAIMRPKARPGSIEEIIRRRQAADAPRQAQSIAEVGRARRQRGFDARVQRQLETLTDEDRASSLEDIEIARERARAEEWNERVTRQEALLTPADRASPLKDRDIAAGRADIEIAEEGKNDTTPPPPAPTVEERAAEAANAGSWVTVEEEETVDGETRATGRMLQYNEKTGAVRPAPEEGADAAVETGVAPGDASDGGPGDAGRVGGDTAGAQPQDQEGVPQGGIDLDGGSRDGVRPLDVPPGSKEPQPASRVGEQVRIDGNTYTVQEEAPDRVVLSRARDGGQKPILRTMTRERFETVAPTQPPSQGQGQGDANAPRVETLPTGATVARRPDGKFDTPSAARPVGGRGVTERSPALQDAARRVALGEMTGTEYQEVVNREKPVRPYDRVPEPATTEQISSALTADKKPRVGASDALEDGAPVGLRLDIPAYSDHDTWVVSVHEGTASGAGKSIGYAPVARARNVTLEVNERAALKVAQGTSKSPFGLMKGSWVKTTPEQARADAEAAMNDPAWVQVGMDPERHSFFYDRTDQRPVVAADEVIQIGPLVLAKNPKYADPEGFAFAKRSQGDTRAAGGAPQDAAVDTPPTVQPDDAQAAALQSLAGALKSLADSQSKLAEGLAGRDAPTENNPEAAKKKTSTQGDSPAIPQGVDALATFDNANAVATGSFWAKGRLLKAALQLRLQDAAKRAGVNVSEPSVSQREYLVRVALKDALFALGQNENAVGWYDVKTRQALAIMSLVYPELATDGEARLAFTWALAVTSNGLKVGMNFEIANKAYARYRVNKVMPNDVGAGTAAEAIDGALKTYNVLRDAWGWKELEAFMLKEATVKDIGGHLTTSLNKSLGGKWPQSQIDELVKTLKPGGENQDTKVRGAAILGPKIGNGFFSNLYGKFDALTMDRWLVRTWGRWTATLITTNPENWPKGRDRVRDALNGLDKKALIRALMKTNKTVQPTKKQKAEGKEARILPPPVKWAPRDRLIAMLKSRKKSDAFIDDLADIVTKASAVEDLRGAMNTKDTKPNDLRLAANGLSRQLDAQKEAPAGGGERNYIREIFRDVLKQLKAMPEWADLTMADLQAVLWYGEKRLYETAKLDPSEAKEADEEGIEVLEEDDGEVEGYEDDDAPDYANAAVAIARLENVSEERIQATLRREEQRGRSGGSQQETGGSQQDIQGDGPSAALREAVGGGLDQGTEGVLRGGQGQGAGPLAARTPTVSDGNTQHPVTAEDLQSLDDPEALRAFLRRPGWATLTATVDDETLLRERGSWFQGRPDRIEAENAKKNASLRADLDRRGIRYVPVEGMYGGKSDGTSLLAVIDEGTAILLGRQYNQESVLTRDGLVYSLRPLPNVPTTGDIAIDDEIADDAYSSRLPGGTKFSLGLALGERGPGIPVIPPGYIDGAEVGRPQLPIRPDGTVELHHWSGKDLTTVDPKFAGTGPMSGAERLRAAKISFFGINPRENARQDGTGYVKESSLGDKQYIALVDARRIYPRDINPDGLPLIESDISHDERVIREAGYLGYYTTDNGSVRQPNAPLGNVAALFEPVDVVPADTVPAPEAARPAADMAGANVTYTEPKRGPVAASGTIASGRVQYDIWRESAQKVATVRGRLQGMLERAGFGDLGMAVVDHLFLDNSNIDGVYHRAMILVAMESDTRTEEQTLLHELIHALRDPILWERETGLFRPGEWRALVNAAKAQPGVEARIREDYAGMTEAKLEEEMVAAYMERWFAGSLEPKGLAARALERVRQFLDAIAAAWRGEGFTTPDAIFNAILEGKMAARRDDRMPMGGVPQEAMAAAQASVWHSPLGRAVINAKQAKAPASDWISILSKLPGVKQVELDWTGITSWLEGLGKTQVTKQELTDFLAGNRIELTEDVRRDQIMPDYKIRRFNDGSAEVYDSKGVHRTFKGIGDEESGLYDFEGLGRDYEDLQDAADAAYNKIAREMEDLEPSFSDYTEEGGTNYREILLRVPNLHEVGPNKPASPKDPFEQVPFGDRKTPFVQRSHFSQENIVVHSRVKDRTGPNGERVLFVEEIQSDLGSKWRESEPETADKQAKRDDLRAQREEINRELQDLTTTLVREWSEVVRKLPADKRGEYSGPQKMMTYRSSAIYMAQGGINSSGADMDIKRAILDTPSFTAAVLRQRELDAARETNRADMTALGTEKKSDPSLPATPWQEEMTYQLMVKRLLREAATGGYDMLAWTPGYMQAERWDTAAQDVLEGVEWVSAGRDGRYVTIRTGGGQANFVVVDESATITTAAGPFGEAKGKPLSTLLGPGLSARIMGEKEGSAEPGAVAFPNTGYAIAYDQQIRSAIDKFAKKYGGKVEVRKDLPDMQARKSAYNHDTTEVVTVDAPRAVWSVTITPEMRAAASESQPMFARKSRMGRNPSAPNAATQQALSQGQRSLWSKVKNKLVSTRNIIDGHRQYVQDRFLPVLRPQQAVEKARGGKIPDEMNGYLHEQAYSSRTDAKLKRIQREVALPIIEIIRRQKGMTEEMVDEYLYARHAQERNAYIASINPKMPDNGSGMTNAQAQATLARLRSGPHAQALREVAAIIDKLRNDTLDERVSMGLMDPVDAAALRRAYQFYVPLKGWKDAEESLDNTGLGSRYSVRGPEDKRAKGRTTLAASPLQAAMAQAEEAVLRGEKNRVGQALYNFVVGNPSPDWQVKTVQMTRYINKTTGMVTTRGMAPTFMPLEDNEIAVKVGGKEHRIVFEDEGLARALGSMGEVQFNAVVGALSHFMRFLSATRTTLAPAFSVINLVRDVTFTQVKVLGGVLGQQKLSMKQRLELLGRMDKSYLFAMHGSWGGLEGETRTKWQKHFSEYEKEGGRIAFFKNNDPQANAVDFSQQLYLARGWKEAGFNPMHEFRGLFSERDNRFLHQLERLNLTTDNAMRLAAFVSAREMGMSVLQAVDISKNLTVNFNRRGIWGPQLNTAYLFFNASIQGLQTTADIVFSKTGVAMAAGLTAYGFVQGLKNAEDSEEDEDGVLAWDKIEPHVLATNWVFMAENGQDAIKIPAPYVVALFPFMGHMAAKVYRGVMTPQEAMRETAYAAVGQMSPLGYGSSDSESFIHGALEAVTPTLADYVLETVTNTDWRGRDIRPLDPYGDYGPQSQKYYANVSTASRVAAETLNDITGGDKYNSGWIDISPEYFDHARDFLLAGTSGFLTQLADIGTKEFQGIPVEIRDWPIARRFYSETGSWVERERFYDFRNEIDEAADRVKSQEENRERPSTEDRKLASLADNARRTSNDLSDLRDRRSAIMEDDRLTPIQRHERLERLQEREERLYLRFNALVERIREEEE